MPVVDCDVANCDYTTADVTTQIRVLLLTHHIDTMHPSLGLLALLWWDHPQPIRN
jgi:hypothetical protein